jgi:hypothetical protein
VVTKSCFQGIDFSLLGQNQLTPVSFYTIEVTSPVSSRPQDFHSAVLYDRAQLR